MLKNMKAIIKPTAAPGVALATVKKPQMGDNDVLIRVMKSSICGTDVHIEKWDEWAQRTIKPPMTIGHEFVGCIVDCGDNVEHFSVGEVVVGEGHIVCGTCRNCLAGRRHLCKNTMGVGVNRTGAFAEYIAIPSANVWHAADGLDLDVLSCFDPLGNAVHTALTFELLGEDVLITGAGPIGCMAAAIARHAGARHVVVTDINPYRLSLAEKLGATRVVDVRNESLADVQQELDMREGFDVGLEMSGSPAGFSQMVDNLMHGGKIALLGILPNHTVIDWDKVIFNSLTIQGIYGRKIYETWYKTTAMLQSGLDISGIITHRFHYTEFQQGFDLMKAGLSGKVILNWEA